MFIRALNVSDAPDAPGVPTVKDVDKDYVELEWTPPFRDGGARITGYVVEKKQAGSNEWVPATADGKPVSGTSAKVDGLTENADYEFRVRAVNAAGPGEPSIPTEMVKVVKKKGEFHSKELLECTQEEAFNSMVFSPLNSQTRFA